MTKRVLPFFLIFCLLFAGCANDPDPTPSTALPTVSPTAPHAATTEPTTEPTTAPTTEPTEPPLPYQNPITGEPMAEPLTARPFASTFNNVPDAMPHHGVSQADIIYECLAEGGATRCLGIFTDIRSVGAIGSVRSARVCFVDIVQAYDAIFSHAGCNTYAETELYNIGWADLDALWGAATPYYYRDESRLNSGYAWEHTLFTTGQDMYDYAVSFDYRLESDEPYDFGLQFAEDGTPDGETANTIVAHFEPDGKTTTMTYDKESGMYNEYENGRDYIDGNTGELVEFKNVFVLKTNLYYYDGLSFMTLTGEGEGYYACGGKIVPILWSRDSNSDSFHYTLEDGTPLTQGIGHSYVAVIADYSTVDYE